ncbi:regulator of protease activity HflC (stomatin/prohibitin superfamily) [Candidatus Fervidibacter sacchari]|uniref:Regulator of protease activity HflC (Stomatin/prohibitin superfamily) n=2 Tax=Candidatus Fervidibacter sacchari TaxID=1448929 RepID=A0ABT2ES47_9BACT|nr:regulator of protease activity HflC (stomatin/prohibitin superfamily) [Candidatus Fervidibacter sacchari]
MPKELMVQLIAFVIVLVLVLISQAIKIVQEWERGVVFRLGRFVRVAGPGIQFIIPLIERMIKVDIRVFTVDVPKQEIITKDNVTVRVNAVVYFRVVDPMAALVRVENYLYATQQVSQTTLRDVVGQSELDELLAHREELNQKLQRIIDTTTDPWGIKVDMVAIKDVELPDAMKRAMARQAEAERERRAKIIHAQGEYQAAETLAQAAEIMGRHPGSLQLRFLQTLTEVATERSTIVVMPVPIDILSAFISDQRRMEALPSSE